EHLDARGRAASRIRIRSAAGGSVIDEIGCACGVPKQVAVSPDGVWIAVRAGAALLVFHMTDPGASVKVQSANPKELSETAVHRSARFHAVAPNPAAVRVHARGAGARVPCRSEWHNEHRIAVPFPSAGPHASGAGETGKAVLWPGDLSSGSSPVACSSSG